MKAELEGELSAFPSEGCCGLSFWLLRRKWAQASQIFTLKVWNVRFYMKWIKKKNKTRCAPNPLCPINLAHGLPMKTSVEGWGWRGGRTCRWVQDQAAAGAAGCVGLTSPGAQTRRSLSSPLPLLPGPHAHLWSFPSSPSGH